MNPMRGAGAAAVLANAVRAGIMASNSGSAIDTPIPCNTVRRDRCFFVMKCMLRTSRQLPLGSLRLMRYGITCRRALLELVTVHDVHHDRGKAIVILLRVTHDG